MAARSIKAVATQPRATALMENSLPIDGMATLIAEDMKGVRKAARLAVMRAMRRSEVW